MLRYVRAVPDIRPARSDELEQLPALEEASDTLFLSLEIGPLPPPGTVESLRAALVVLVAGDPPARFPRIDRLDDGAAHLEQLAVHPDHGRQGIGRALVMAACRWAGEAGYPSSRWPRTATCPGTVPSTRPPGSSRSDRSTSGAGPAAGPARSRSWPAWWPG